MLVRATKHCGDAWRLPVCLDLLDTMSAAARVAIAIGSDIQYENRHKVTAVPVQLTEKCMVLVLAMYGGARRMHALHASALG